MEKFIITDPCYIMDDRHYELICMEHACKFENQKFPLWSLHKGTRIPIIFHNIKGTPHGDGAWNVFCVDAGMLCIAECAEGWDTRLDSGKTYKTLKAAKTDLTRVLRHF